MSQQNKEFNNFLLGVYFKYIKYIKYLLKIYIFKKQNLYYDKNIRIYRKN